MSRATPEKLPCHPGQITPHWLTQRLRANGVLPTGRVTQVRTEPGPKWNIATTARLHLTFDKSAPGTAPQSLFAKIRTDADPYEEHYPGEYAFFREPLSPGLPLPLCYGAWRDSAGVTCILLQDLSDTHEQPPWPQTATDSQARTAITALARLHAHWWQPTLSSSDQSSLKSRLVFFAETIQRLCPAFLDHAGDRLTEERRTIMSHVADRLPQLLANRLMHGPVTRVHGDPHTGNILFPRGPARHGCVVIDWEDWHLNPPAFDLAYMMAFHWSPNRRARLERPLLRHFQRQLGQPYNREQLHSDYRLGHLHNFVVPWFQLEMSGDPAIWSTGIDPLFDAFVDLGCAEILS